MLFAVIKAEKIETGFDDLEDWYAKKFWPIFNIENKVFEEEYSFDDGRHFLWRQHYEKAVGNIKNAYERRFGNDAITGKL